MTVYGNMPTTQNNAWANSGPANPAPYVCRGGDVNLGGYPEHDWVGIQYADNNTTSSQPYPMVDEIAILIY